MQSFETSATVENHGEVRVAGVPFAAGTEVEVTISPKRRSAEEFAAAWRRLCTQLRAAPVVRDIREEDIQKEILDHRAGQ